MKPACALSMLVLALSAGCAWLVPREEEPPGGYLESEAAAVVDSRGPFDPAEAVTDDDDAPDTAGAELAGRSLEADRRPRRDPPDRRREGAADDAAKVARARNAPPEELPPENPPFLTGADIVFDTLLVLGLAALVASVWTGLARLVRRAKR